MQHVNGYTLQQQSYAIQRALKLALVSALLQSSDHYCYRFHYFYRRFQHKRNAAAARIQARARGARDRAYVKELRRRIAAAIVIQAVGRGHCARSEARRRRRAAAAATVLCAFARGCGTRAARARAIAALHSLAWRAALCIGAAARRLLARR